MQHYREVRKKPTGWQILRPFIPILLLVTIGGAIALFSNLEAEREARATVRLDYARASALDLSVITHSGETVGQVLQTLRSQPHDDGLRGLLQPYLEPMSAVISEHVVRTDTFLVWTDLATSLLQAGTDRGNGGENSRPAWADILFEGRFRILFTGDAVRVYLPGSSTGEALRAYKHLVRYPIQYLKESGLSSCTDLNVFAFRNSYEGLQIALDTRPHATTYADLIAPPGTTPLNLAGLEAFFASGAVPEAIEISDDGKFYLYGRKGNLQTMAGEPMALSDLAVAYRAVFWPAHNEPYISLDKHEDNRYAKVNFGGLLQDTRIGQVVLDADRYFKTLSSGLDPFERKDIQRQIRDAVPGFVPSDVAELQDDRRGSAEFRYWFYPDSLQVATDGQIGAVASCRFLADVERQDQPVAMSRAQRYAIDDLNRRYGQYKTALPTYAELDNVGRLLGLMYWLKESGAARKVDLASLLSVELPAWKTERRTNKMLVVTSYNGPERFRRHSSNDFHKRTRVFDFSGRLKERGPNESDKALLSFASRCFGELPARAYTSSEDLETENRIETEKRRLDRLEKDIDRLEREINDSERTLNRYSQSSIDAHNRRVDAYNGKVEEFQRLVSSYNRLIEAQNSSGIVTQQLASVGGGIELSMRRMKVTRTAARAPAIRSISAAKPNFVNTGSVQVSGEWVRSAP